MLQFSFDILSFFKLAQGSVWNRMESNGYISRPVRCFPSPATLPLATVWGIESQFIRNLSIERQKTEHGNVKASTLSLAGKPSATGSLVNKPYWTIPKAFIGSRAVGSHHTAPSCESTCFLGAVTMYNTWPELLHQGNRQGPFTGQRSDCVRCKRTSTYPESCSLLRHS